ncbi:hypothetical protein JCM8547_008957 [Rhodosporidiobolus lusitaniae]
MSRTTQSFDLTSLGAGWTVEEREDGRQLARLERIEVSPNDDRAYRFITLANGLKALLISDPKTDKAAAALGVQVGHLSDPDDLPGLAHFCEHMLFLGTERFPDEAEYKTYLSRHGGSSNAYTSLAETVYHFDCTPAGLPGALARHAQFFTSPLFDVSCTERELNAVNSEFARNLSLDARRLFQLGKSLSSKESVYRKFGTGSKETLGTEPKEKGEDVRERLLSWYRETYSANLMNLVVLSNHSLDELAEIVSNEYSDIPNANLHAEDYLVPPISANEAKTEVSYRTIKDTPQLRIEFGLPDLQHHYHTKPGRYISHFVGHEGPGSILAELKSRGWATSLSSSTDNGARGFDFLRINISLTAVGLTHYKSVLAIVWQYIELLKSTPPVEWSWEETKKLGELAWRWKEKGQPQSTTRNLASQLGEELYPPERALVGPWFAMEWDAEVVKKTLEELKFENLRVFVGSKEPLEGREFWKEKEKYYGTEYDVQPLNVSQLGTTLSPFANLAIPEPNIFIPSKLELVTPKPVDEPFMRPTLVRKTAISRLWVKTDDTWCIPRGTAYILVRSPVSGLTPRHAVLTQLFTNIVEEALSAYAYDASLAHLDYSLGVETDGFMLVVSGYTDKLPLLQKVVLEKVRSLQVEGKVFELVHDRLVRAYKNAKLNNPYQLADSNIRLLTRETHWTYDERLAALEGLTSSDVEQHASSLLSEVELDMLVAGNFRREEAVQMLDDAEALLQSSPADPEKNDYHRALVLPEGTTTVYRPHVDDKENLNSAASVYYQIGSTDDHELLATLSLFAQIAKVPVFSQLRTVEQLGYIVSSSTWVINAFAGFRVVVQSERAAEYLDERIDVLWQTTFKEHLGKMSEEEFEKEREAVALKKLEKAKSLGQETSRYWQEVETGELDWFCRERQAALVRQLKKTDIFDFFNRFISPSSPSRTKLTILMRSQRLQPAALEPFLAIVRSTAPSAAEAAASLVASKPTIERLVEFVHSQRGQMEDAWAVEAELEKLQELAPRPDGMRELREEQLNDFRKSLPRAPGYKPVVSTYEEDLVQAHL